MQKKFFYMLPLVIFFTLCLYLMVTLMKGQNPEEIASVYIGKQVPQFSLSELNNRDLTEGDHIKILNFFASWCAPCTIEHPQIINLEARGIPVFGIAFKDTPENIKTWFEKKVGKNPYQKIGYDLDGKASIDWGVNHVPETFIIDRHGIILYRHSGPILPSDLTEKILPVIEGAKS